MGESALISSLWSRAQSYANHWTDKGWEKGRIDFNVSLDEIHFLAKQATGREFKSTPSLLWWLKSKVHPRHFCQDYGPYHVGANFERARRLIEMNLELDRRSMAMKACETGFDVTIPYKLLEELVNVCLKSKDG